LHFGKVLTKQEREGEKCQEEMGLGQRDVDYVMDPVEKQVGVVSKADKRVKVLRPGVKKVSANRLSSSSPTFHSIAGKSFVY
jgi:hypothetical protein